MLYELQRSDYNKIYPLVGGNEETKVLPVSVLSKNNLGKVFVDNAENPKTAIIWVLGNAFYFFGDSSNAYFINSLNEFIDRTIAPLSKELVGINSSFETLIYDESWNQALKRVFQNRSLTKQGDDCDYMFTFNCKSYLATKEREIILPKDYAIKKINNDCIVDDTYSPLRIDILDFWQSTDDFLEKGFGYFLLKNNKSIAVCFSAYVHEHWHEIAIRTYIQEERRKGFATATARAYLNECLKKGLIPAWSTQNTNVISHALAEKLGFEFHSKLPSIMFSLN
jgi:GNAT superfamily N-acetyltransferase